LLKITGGNYEMVWPDGSKKIFGLFAGSGTNTYVFLTQVVDPAGNAVTLTYDGIRLVGPH